MKKYKPLKTTEFDLSGLYVINIFGDVLSLRWNRLVAHCDGCVRLNRGDSTYTFRNVAKLVREIFGEELKARKKVMRIGAKDKLKNIGKPSPMLSPLELLQDKFIRGQYGQVKAVTNRKCRTQAGELRA
jgi:hypothetical protein